MIEQPTALTLCKFQQHVGQRGAPCKTHHVKQGCACEVTVLLGCTVDRTISAPFHSPSG